MFGVFVSRIKRNTLTIFLFLTWYCFCIHLYVTICMKHDPGMHMVMHLVFFRKTGVTNTTLPLSIQFLVLEDYEHITLHTPWSKPHWRSTHRFLRQFDLLSTTRLWARHVAYSSIMPTLEINTSLPSSIRSPSTCVNPPKKYRTIA
jgi:hypothetical protein